MCMLSFVLWCWFFLVFLDCNWALPTAKQERRLFLPILAAACMVFPCPVSCSEGALPHAWSSKFRQCTVFPCPVSCSEGAPPHAWSSPKFRPCTVFLFPVSRGEGAPPHGWSSPARVSCGDHTPLTVIVQLMLFIIIIIFIKENDPERSRSYILRAVWFLA